MDVKEVQTNPAKEHKEKKKTHKHNKHHKHDKRHHHRHQDAPSKEPQPQKTKKRCGMCRVQKAPHAKVKEKVGEKNLDARGKDDKILGGQQHKAKLTADEANAQPPQGTTAVNGEIEPVGSKPEKKKEKTAKGEQEPKGSPGRLPQENATIVLQDTKKRKAHVKEGQKHKKGRHRKRSKVTQGSAVALDAMDKKSSQQPEAAAPPGQQIASSQACGDGPAKEPTVPTTTTTSLPPATAVGGNVEINADKTPSTITSVSQQSKTSVGGTPTLPWEGIDKEAETTYARGAQKVPSDENKGAGDGKSSQLLGANEMEQRKSDGTEEGERRRKEADKDAMVVRKQIVTTRADDEDDITRAIRKSSAISKRPVSQVKKVREFVRSISNDGLEGMRKSFIRCKVYLPNAATRTYFDQNQDRVRYRDVICIDQTRVILKCQPDGSDFIHASRIPIGDSPNQLIVTQVPLANTVQHFWEMVWQEKAEAVLLLLTMDEWKAHVEQLNLIPSKLQCLHLKNMTITVASEMQVEKNWAVLELGLTKDDRSRRIVWHHYSGWKESKGGADIQAIWKIHSSLRKLRRPLICMSMAGAGRAGTYAVLEWAHAMHHDKYRPTVSVEDCVRKVREYRMHSVQSLAQYQYIYMLLLRHIFLVKKIRDDYLSDPAMQKDLENCIEVEQQYFHENMKDGDEEPEITLRCC